MDRLSSAPSWPRAVAAPVRPGARTNREFQSLTKVIEFLQYPLALLVTLGVLVTFHELGHFLVARLSGVRVVRFSVGFGKPIWSRTDRRGTEFAVAAIPLGGYVRMLDEREPGVIEVVRQPGDLSYMDLGVWWRIAIAAAGPAANFLLAFLVYWLLFVAGTLTPVPMLGTVPEDSPAGRAGLQAGAEIVSVDGRSTRSWQEVTMALAGRLGDSGDIEVGTRQPGDATASVVVGLPITAWHRGTDEPDLLGSLGIEPALPAVLGEVLPDTAGERAGLERHDTVVAVDGEPVASWGEWVTLVQQAPDQPLEVRLRRAGREQTVTVRPESRQGASGATGFVGVAPYTNDISYGVLAAVPRSVAETWDKTALTLGLLKKMVVGDVSMKNLSGPITIAKVAGDSARSGWRFYLGVLALLSISLGVLNLLPIPILDGGHILFCAAEAATGKPVSERTQIVGTQIGLFLVAGLMIIAFYNDISRLF